METNEFIKWLRTQKNPAKIEGMENYMRNQFTFLGLQATERRELAAPFLKHQVRETKAIAASSDGSVINWKLLFTLWEQPEREFQLIGLDYLKRVQSLLVLEDLNNLRQLVLTKSWWDTVDFLSKSIGEIVQHEPILTDEMLAWSLEENIWIRRVSILHQLAFKEETNTNLLHKIILNNIEDNEFFIQKAIGWTLREYAKSNELWVRHFTMEHQNQLSNLSYREATKNLST